MEIAKIASRTSPDFEKGQFWAKTEKKRKHLTIFEKNVQNLQKNGPGVSSYFSIVFLASKFRAKKTSGL